MGVPTFFRWLTLRNPKIVLDCDEPLENQTSSNPEIHNFYIDMNGLIHPSCNPQDNNVRIPTCFQQQCENVFDYIDKLMNIVRPTKLVYMAIDGVAPRAKMNQQRSRRFRAAKESIMGMEKKQELKQFYIKHGIYSQQIEDYLTKKPFDSNVITPGTQFLWDLSLALKFYIVKRMNQHPRWKHLKVIFSDANNPGEGQHKIMEFIRQQRAGYGYDPNQSHCIYGADADLIMLGLMTHEPRFYIIREIIVTRQQKRCTSCGRVGHFFTDCTGQDIQGDAQIAVSFQFVRLQYVRDQLHYHFSDVVVPFGYDLERIIDDFVFMCFFVGNDFLPHLPSLNIREGGIDVLIFTYQRILHRMPGYLIDAGILNLQSLNMFITQLSKMEDALIEENIKRQEIMRRRDNMNKTMNNSKPIPKKQQNSQIDLQQYLKNPLQKFKTDLKLATSTQLNNEGYSEFSHPIYGSKQKFYTQKFRIAPSDFVEFRHKISQSYIQALSWICLYYYKGVQSWSWYYPYHYSPFLSDIRVSEYDPKKFQLGQPFRPFEQLMAVFPPKTSWAIPQCLQTLMQSTRSPIADYFPTDFLIDVLGKKFSWMGEVLLPFIEESRLLKAMGTYTEQLTKQQAIRNSLGNSLLFFRQDVFPKMPKSHSYISHEAVGLEGECRPVENNAIKSNQQISNPLGFAWPSVENNQVQCCAFYQPSGKLHYIQLKEGINLDQYQVDQEYVGRTDTKSFNGQRMLTLVNKFLGPSPKARGDLGESAPLYHRRSSSGWEQRQDYRGRDHRRDEQRRDSRSRSRDRRGNNQDRYNDNDNRYRGRHYRNQQRIGQRNDR